MQHYRQTLPRSCYITAQFPVALLVFVFMFLLGVVEGIDASAGHQPEQTITYSGHDQLRGSCIPSNSLRVGGSALGVGVASDTLHDYFFGNDRTLMPVRRADRRRQRRCGVAQGFDACALHDGRFDVAAAAVAARGTIVFLSPRSRLRGAGVVAAYV